MTVVPMIRAQTLVPWKGPLWACVATAACFLGDAAAHEEAAHGAPSARSTASSSDALLVARTLENYASAIESKDLARVKPLLVGNDEFSFFEGTYVNIGWQSYHDHLAPELAMFETPRYRLTEIQPFVSGNLGYATFAWSLDVTVLSDKFEGGKHAVSMNGRGTAVLSKVNGAWRIRHLQTAQAPAKRVNSESH